MSRFDCIIHGGTVVAPGGETVADIGIYGESIVEMKPGLVGTAREEVDARGLHIFPGVIDSHVHFNDPGRAQWEGIETGSRALAAGGGTMFFDMPLNASPPTCDAASFDLKLAVARKNSLTDFAFWGGLVPENLGQLEALAARGVIGFKAFMSDSGIADFSRADEDTLRQGMKIAAKLNLPVAVHAESETLTKELAAKKIAAGMVSVRDYLDSRPVDAELEAVRRAIDLAGETRCKLHIVHISSGAGIALVASAKKSGVDVSCETCPHYLTLTENDVEKLGAVAKCAPPLRSTKVQKELWQKLVADQIDIIGSDHSPAPPDMKTSPDFFRVWGGISGAQHTLSLLLTGCSSHRLTLVQIANLLSFNVAERFRLPQTRGRIEVGADADLALVDLSQSFAVHREDLFYRHKQSPYLGRTLTGGVVQTILRGKMIFKDGKAAGTNRGQLIKPI